MATAESHPEVTWEMVQSRLTRVMAAFQAIHEEHDQAAATEAAQRATTGDNGA
jgi:hypothetical protein